MTKIESIKKHGESAQGRKELMRYLKGKSLSLSESVVARCYDCMSYYADGVADCKSPDCPLYLFMPYRTLTRKKKAAAKRTASKKTMNKKAAPQKASIRKIPAPSPVPDAPARKRKRNTPRNSR